MAFGKSSLGLVVAAFCVLLSACATTDLAGTMDANLAPPDAPAPPQEYRISPNDKLSISVYPATVTNFSMPSVRVDATGNILFPATGILVAQGKTSGELAAEIQGKLAACCLRQPQVVVQIEETISQQITINGAVVQAGAYNLRGTTTLMQALALARGPDRATADMTRVAVYRMSGGQRTGGIFNLKDILAGKAQDPVIYGGDMIYVDSSQAKSAWRNIVSAVPFVGAFGAF